MTRDDDRERADLLQALDQHRALLRRTVRDIDDDAARRRTTVSELCLAGIVKHVAWVEQRWARFIVDGPGAMGGMDEAAFAAHVDSFRPSDAETLDALLVRYDDVARSTDDLVGSLPSLDADQPLPEAPWFEPGARWSARRVLVHIVAETAQHAGHADIVREALDGAKTMG